MLTLFTPNVDTINGECWYCSGQCTICLKFLVYWFHITLKVTLFSPLSMFPCTTRYTCAKSMLIVIKGAINWITSRLGTITSTFIWIKGLITSLLANVDYTLYRMKSTLILTKAIHVICAQISVLLPNIDQSLHRITSTFTWRKGLVTYHHLCKGGALSQPQNLSFVPISWHIFTITSYSIVVLLFS